MRDGFVQMNNVKIKYGNDNLGMWKLMWELEIDVEIGN